jgi:hypothetical protein
VKSIGLTSRTRYVGLLYLRTVVHRCFVSIAVCSNAFLSRSKANATAAFMANFLRTHAHMIEAEYEVVTQFNVLYGPLPASLDS